MKNGWAVESAVWLLQRLRQSARWLLQLALGSDYGRSADIRCLIRLFLDRPPGRRHLSSAAQAEPAGTALVYALPRPQIASAFAIWGLAAKYAC